MNKVILGACALGLFAISIVEARADEHSATLVRDGKAVAAIVTEVDRLAAFTLAP